jgi:ABC-type glycerol-3-phosphate transport system permease component
VTAVALTSHRVGRRRWRRTLRPLTVVVVLLIVLFPVYYLILTSMSTADQIISTDTDAILPRHLTLTNFADVLADPNFARFAFNSLLVAISVTILSVSVSAIAGYALARLQFRGSRTIGRFVLFAYIAPPVLLAVPMFVIMSHLGLVNTPFALILAHASFAIPFCIWVLRGFFLTIPPELEEAAMVDGATRLHAFRRIVLPLAGPGLLAAAMFSFLLSWNEYFYALVFLQNNGQMTLPIGIQSTYFNLAMGPDEWVRLLAASVLVSIPVFIIFVGLQRWMVSGLTAGSVKG